MLAVQSVFAAGKVALIKTEYCGALVLSIIANHEAKATSSLDRTRATYSAFRDFRNASLKHTQNSDWSFDEVSLHSADASKKDREKVALRIRGLEKIHETYSIDDNVRNQTFGVQVRGREKIDLYLKAQEQAALGLSAFRKDYLNARSTEKSVSNLMWLSASFFSFWPGIQTVLSSTSNGSVVPVISFFVGTVLLYPVYNNVINFRFKMREHERAMDSAQVFNTMRSAIHSPAALENKEKVWVYVSKNLDLPADFLNLLKNSDTKSEYWYSMLFAAINGEINPRIATKQNGYAELLVDQLLFYENNEPVLNIYIRFQTPQPTPTKTLPPETEPEFELELKPIKL